MLFNSLPFVFFFLIVFGVYYLPPLRRFQVAVLIVSSFVFYAWASPPLLALLLFSISVNALTSFQVARAERRGRIAWATAGVVVNLAVLGFFKYGALLSGLVLDAFGGPRSGAAQTVLLLPLPIGISFYTFEGISLLVDTLRRREPGTSGVPFIAATGREHLERTGLFVAFFPHLVAGPILKARDFYPQIGPKRFRDVPWTRVFQLLVTGYFLKMVVADNLKLMTFWIAFPYFQAQATLTNLALLYGYSIQIFADFAGYSLIAIGLAAAFGYVLPDNFNFPYVSRSLAEFWRRWHISLSTWLRDYLYFPLGGNRRGPTRTYLNLLTVMVLGGLWHGAAWSYAFWGLFHGVGLAAERAVGGGGPTSAADQPFGRRLLRDACGALAVFAFVTFGWLFFKLPDFHQALWFLSALAHNWRITPDPMLVAPVALFSLPVVVYHLLHFPTWQDARGAWCAGHPRRWAACRDLCLSIMLALLILNSGNSSEFIYFQF